MSEPNGAASSGPRIAAPTGGHAERVSTVARYLDSNRDRFTEDALVRAARDRGYPEDVLEEARARARATVAAAPLTQRARRVVQAGYLLTFAVLAVAMFASEASQQYGGANIGTVILAVTLGIGLLVSLAWLRWLGDRVGQSAAATAALFSLPLVLLVVIAGSCIATGLPIPRS